MRVCQIDKIINDEGYVMYQIYYYDEKEQDWTMKVPFELNDKQEDDYFESTNSLEEAIKLIIELKCTLVGFNDNTW